uniref:F-box domain-containing protein n=1 Tax=Oryza barthii TaxID=65489 RepID=A0A0D3HAY3_9ORYZ
MASPSAAPALPDEMLVEIFLRLDDPADHARVSAACATFRRLISGRAFLRRIRARHARPLLGLIGHFASPCGWRLHFDYFLAPSAGDGEEGEDSSFGVVCRAWTRDVSMVAVFVFSSSAGSWRAVTIDGYRPRFTLCRRQYTHGCFYWFTSLRGKLLMLNARDMEISIVEFPQSCFGIGQHAIVEAGEGRLGLFTIGDCNLDLHSKAIGAGSIAGDNEWRHDKTIPLLPRYKWDIMNAAEGFLLLKGFPLDHYPPRWIPTEIPCFTLELKTLLLKRLRMLHLRVVCDALLLYRSFPPPLSLPSI